MYELSHKLSNNLIRLYEEIREVLENLTQKANFDSCPRKLRKIGSQMFDIKIYFT